MKLSQIINEVISDDMALTKLPIIARELGNVVSTFAAEIDDAVKWNDPGVLLPAVGKIANWVHTNYKSSKRIASGHNIESLMQQLAKNPKFKKDAEKCQQLLTFNMERDKKQSSLAQFEIILSSIDLIMNKVGIKNNLDSTIDTYYEAYDKYKKLRAVKMRDRGIDTRPTTATEPTHTKDIAPTQRAQVETVVNHILSTLSKQDAASIRTAISKSDNKLQSLKKEMDIRGL